VACRHTHASYNTVSRFYEKRKILAWQRLVLTFHEHVGKIRQEGRKIKHADGNTDATSLPFSMYFVQWANKEIVATVRQWHQVTEV
jgi:hypothetical protein